MSERVTNQRLAEMIANLADSTGWFGDIYDGLTELQERRASSPAAGRDAVIEECAKHAETFLRAQRSVAKKWLKKNPDIGRIYIERGDMAADIVAGIRLLKETPNGN